VTRPAPSGYFEPLEGGRVRGWAADASGRPAPVRVHVNGSLAMNVGPRRTAFLDLGGGGEARCRFDAELRLVPGDRIEVFHGLTGEPLAGGVRTVVDPHWRPRVALVTPVREEARYLLEWIAYHRALGVETFLLGDNGGDDETSELIVALDEAGLVHRTDWLGAQAFQIDFDQDSVARMRGLADVVSLTDVDEFLRPLNGRTDVAGAIAEIFARLEVSALALSLVVYGSSGRVEPGEGLVIERFTKRAPDDHVYHRTVKTILRPERLAAMLNPHQVALTDGEYVDDRGEPVRWADAPAVTRSASWNSLRAEHVVVKSYREFAVKAARGRVDMHFGIADRDEAFFRSRDRNEVEDPIPAEFVERTKDELARVRDRLKRFSRRWPALSAKGL
jgi:Glycosyl transferase family 2